MTHDLFINMAHERRDELLRQADERRLAAAARATKGRREPHFERARWRRRFAGPFAKRGVAPAEARACEL